MKALSLLALLSVSASAAPTFEALRDAHRPSEATLLDRRGDVLQELRVDPRGRRLTWVKLSEVSPAFRRTLLRVEDHRFAEHSGVDWRALAASAVRGLAGRARGASTISMQLVALLEPALLAPKGRKTLAQKLGQIRAALELEMSWTKDEILETYLNRVHFRGELQGLRAAAQGLFSKDPHGLSEAESLLLVTLIQSPNAAPAAVARRACGLSESLALGVSCAEVSRLVSDRLSRLYAIQPRLALAPHAARHLLGGGRLATVRSTLDRRVQESSVEALRNQVAGLRGRNVQDGAVLVLDNRTGDVLAYVGGLGELASARFVDGVRARRQAGSTLKPFLYALAFERRQLTPGSLLDDSPHAIPVFGGLYRPRNFDEVFHGPVEAHLALASSLNVPAVKTLESVGVSAFLSLLGRLGFEGLRTQEFYGPSLALGSADVTLWELTNAYRALANGGISSQPRLGPPVGGRRRSLSAEASHSVSHILSLRESRAATFGLESPLGTRSWSAAKTGTSKDMRDNWCVGFSDRYTVGVWVGNSSGMPMWNVSGIAGAAPVWSEIMNRLHLGRPSREPSPPKGMTLAGGQWYLAGTAPEPATENRIRLGREPRITSPVDGTIVAFDPDIPPGRQKLFFEADSRLPGDRWVLDGSDVGDAGTPFGWTPQPAGPHRLELVRQGSAVLDAVRFEVRGADSSRSL